MGAQGAERSSDQRIVKALVYAQQKASIEYTGGALHDGILTWNLGWRAVLDGTPPTTATTSAAGTTAATAAPASNAQGTIQGVDKWQQQVTIRALSVAYAKSFARLELGFQEISWGETFGSQIIDVVNPRDYGDPLNTDLSWVRLPVAAANAQFFLGGLTLQLIYVPIPRSNEYPLNNSPYSPSAATPGLTVLPPPTLQGSGSVPLAEYGGRLSYLTPFGLDLGLVAYSHWNRNVVYQAVSQTEVQPYQAKTTTLGMTASLALGPFVLRQDAAAHLNQPLQADAPGQVIPNATQFQTISGIDVTIFGNWFLGSQFQHEDDEFTGGNRELNWIAFKTAKTWFHDTVETDVFYQKGLDNPDVWVQSSLTFNLPGGIAWTLRDDYVDGSLLPSQGYYYLLNGQSRYMSMFSVKF